MSMRVASAPVSWGVMENIPLPENYTADLVLDEIAQAGYAGTELGRMDFCRRIRKNCERHWRKEA